MPNPQTIRDILTLAELHRPHWPALRASIPAWHPRNDEETAEEKAAREKAEADAKAEAEKKAAADAEAAKKAEEDNLGDAGKAALAAERKARKDAEKAAKEAKAKLDAIEAEKLTEAEKLKKQAEEGQQLASTATEKLCRANLLVALGEQGLHGARAKAAARLLDDVEYDDDDEPTNLEEAIKAATAEFGEEMFKGAKPKPKPPATGAGEGGDDGEKPSLTAEELEFAKAFGMNAEEYANYKAQQPQLPAKTT